MEDQIQKRIRKEIQLPSKKYKLEEDLGDNDQKI